MTPLLGAQSILILNFRPSPIPKSKKALDVTQKKAQIKMSFAKHEVDREAEAKWKLGDN